MKKLASNFKNMVLVLSGITLFAALALASVYSFTKEPIELAKKAKQQNAIKEVLPPYDHIDENPVEINDGVEVCKVFKAYDKANQFVGAAVESSSNNGFSGKISIMVGFDKDANIVNYSVLEQNETPGLGAKMGDWFKTDKGRQSVIGRNAAKSNLTVSKDGGEVDAITAATISSRAFLFAVRNAYAAFSASESSAVKDDSVSTEQNDSIPVEKNTEK